TSPCRRCSSLSATIPPRRNSCTTTFPVFIDSLKMGRQMFTMQAGSNSFGNYDDSGNRLARPRTLLIDSEQLESGEALDPEFREIAGAEIDIFKREKAAREGAAAAEKISDSDLLREVMNTVGKKGKLGEQIRCVVSVAMLTE